MDDKTDNPKVICPSCHTIQPLDHDFCGKCGASLESAQVIQLISRVSVSDQTQKNSPPRLRKSKVPIVAALLCGLIAGARQSGLGGSIDVPLLHGVATFLFWWVVLAVLFRLIRPKTPAGRIGLAIAVIVGVPALINTALAILMLIGPSIGSSFSPDSGSYTPQPLVAAPTATQAPSIKSHSPTRYVSQVPTPQPNLGTAPSPVIATPRPHCTNTACPVVKQPSPSLPVEPSPDLATPAGRSEWFNQTVTVIENRLATASVDAVIAAQNQTITPTPAPCHEDVSIILPRHGSIVKGLVDIRGTAIWPSFQFYKLEYSSRAQPTSDDWITIGEPHSQPVINGQLATWDTSNLPNGQVWLRLVVVDQTGNFPKPCQIMVVLSK